MSSSAQARQRLISLLDENSFVEIGAGVRARATDFGLKTADTPSDGVITGYGLIDGRLVYVYSQDASVLGGSIGEMHARKITAVYDLAIRTGAPVIGLLDSAGLRLQEGIDSLEAFASIYARQSKASGVIPQLCAVFGQCGGGLAVAASLCDFTFMESGARLFVNAPNTIAGNTEEKDNTSSAASKEACGNVDYVGSEGEILGQIRELIGVLPSNNEDDADADCEDDMNRDCPSAAAHCADPAALMEEAADYGRFIELKKDFAPEMAVGFVKLGGWTAGVIGNRSAAFDEEGECIAEYEPVLTADGCMKAADFVRFCDAFELPLITLTSVRGFASSKQEEQRIASAAAKLTSAIAGATVPKVNVITGRTIGSAYAVMNAKSSGADLTFAFPAASVGIMDPDLAARIMAPDAGKEALKETAVHYEAVQNSIGSAAARGFVDQIVEPAALRKYLIGALEILYTKREELPSRKHSTR